jgi:hypothetical protein
MRSRYSSGETGENNNGSVYDKQIWVPLEYLSDKFTAELNELEIPNCNESELQKNIR